MYIKPHTDVLKHDALGVILTELVGRYQPESILEIGSSDGLGSTRVFAEAIKGTACELYCIEMQEDRFSHLKSNMISYQNVYPYLCASVGVHGMFERGYIETFQQSHPDFTIWKVMTMEEILTWYDSTRKQIPMMQITEGIEHIKYDNDIQNFDMVFMDGGPFTAMAELELVYGSGVIIMDDTMDLKCYDTMIRLLTDTNYKLLHRDDQYRNGFAVFKWKHDANS